MEFFTLDDDGLHAGIEVLLPRDNFIHIGRRMWRRIVAELKGVRADFKSARVLLAGGTIAVPANNRLFVTDEHRDSQGAVLLSVELPPGHDEKGLDLPIQLIHHGDESLVVQIPAVGPRALFVVFQGADFEVIRPMGVMPPDGLLPGARLRRIAPGPRGPLPLRPTRFEAEGWLATPPSLPN